MAKHDIVVVIPTLRAGQPLQEALDSLARQTWKNFEVIVVDNSVERRAAYLPVETRYACRVLYLENNEGYGGAINRALACSEAPLVVVLNDDAVADAQCLESLAMAASAYPEFGMFSCQIRLAGTGRLDSTALALARDGSSIQRSHSIPMEQDRSPGEALLPSGCAALYRRKALEDAGFFDETFFLYGEDTDLGLRLLWQGWRCRYVASAIVDHAYSATSGAASPLKAYLVERNRQFLVVKNFPFTDAIAAFCFSPLRYLFHVMALLSGKGKTAQFVTKSNPLILPLMVCRAYLATLMALPHLLRQRDAIRRKARVSKEEFRAAIYTHRVSLWKVAQH